MISGAIAFSSRSMIAPSTISDVRKVALRGSPLFVRVARAPLRGTMLWLPRAWRIRGAPTKEASAEEKVAASSPARTAGPQNERSIIT